MSVLLSAGLWLLLLGQSLAGVGDEMCAVPDYPVNVRVLLDSWRYRTLLTGTRDTGWAAFNNDKMHNTSWYSDGECGENTVSVCNEAPGDKWLLTPPILKTLPAPDNYSVRIFVNVTYSFMECTKRGCTEFELLLATYSSGERSAYGGDDLMPDNHIRTPREPSSGTKHFFFDSESSVTAVFLALRSREACVTVSRVLVYLYECPGHDRQSTGLERRPATQAPVSGAVPVSPVCAENAHFSDFTHPNTLVCTSEGMWGNDLTHCECDTGYSEDEERTTCERATPNPSDMEPKATSTASEPPQTVPSAQVPPQPTSGSSQTHTPSISPSSTPSPLRPTVEGATDDRGQPPIAILAGVGGLLVVILTLILVVVALIVTLVRKNRKSKPKESDQQLSNPVYDAVAQNIDIKFPTSTTSNGNGTTEHKQDGATLHNFSNPLYHTGQRGPNSNGKHKSQSTTQNGNTYFEEPQYSVPNSNGTAHAEYELPVTSPTPSEGPTPPPPLSPSAHVYDYATLPPGLAPEYATLEPPVHAYHTLEFPSDTGGTVPATSAETCKAGQGGGGGGASENVYTEQEYSVIGQQ